MKKTYSRLLQCCFAVILVILINFLAQKSFFRVDLTAEKRFTLHPETENLLRDLTDKVTIQVYLAGPDLPTGFKHFRKALQEMLVEFKGYASYNLEFVFIDPTAAEDKAIRFANYKKLHEIGLRPIESQVKDSHGKISQIMVFPGAIITSSGKSAGVNLLKTDSRFKLDGDENINNSIQALEYELTNAIRKLHQTQKPKIAFLEGHGELPEVEVMDISAVLSEYYDVRRGAVGGKVGVLDEFDMVVVADPQQEFPKADKYALDQYIMQGGKVLWMVSGVQNRIDSTTNADVMALANDIGLIDQLFRYGARVNPNLVRDLQCSPIGLMQQAANGQPRIQLYKWPYFPILVSENNNVVNKYVAPVRSEYISTVDTVGTNPAVEKTVLLSSSKFTNLHGVPIYLKLNDATKPIQESEYTGESKPVAILLEGEFDSAFKNRPVAGFASNDVPFREKSLPTKMIVVGGGSIIRNDMNEKGEVIPAGFDRSARKLFKGNREFLLNAVNYLCDDKGLMSVRNREIKLRLLDKERVIKERTPWQVINLVVPIVFFLVFGLIWHFVRRYRFARKS